MPAIELTPIGRIESPLTELTSAPKQADEGAPAAWIVFVAPVREAVADLRPGDRIVVLTWLDRADRGVLRVRPRDDPASPMRGVCSTRSPDRPNPIGLHEAEIVEVDGLRVRVHAIEALDGTPVLDVKPVLPPRSARSG